MFLKVQFEDVNVFCYNLKRMTERLSYGFYIGVSVILLSFALAGGALYWLYTDLNTKVVEITTGRGTIQERIQEVGLLADLKNSAKSAEDYQKVMDTILPDQNKLFDFPRWIDNLASNYSITDRFSFQGNQTPSQGSTPGYVGFSVDITGSMQNIVSFMKSLETTQGSQFLVTIDSFDLNQASDKYHVILNGKVFFK